MKKIILKIFICAMFISAMSITFFAIKPKKFVASADWVDYVTTCVGETETSVGINYHSNVGDGMVIYSTSPTFTPETTKSVKATSYLWHKDQMPDDKNTGFDERYVCKANLDNLEENTKYYYRVTSGSVSSSVYTFKTYSKSKKVSNILFATDIHVSTSMPKTPGRANSMFEAILRNKPDINLFVSTGDNVDRGGYEAHWNLYYQNMRIFQNIINAQIPGNHEYYHSKDSAYVSPEIFNQYYNNPQNGAEPRLNSSFYFKYGNALFIMIDTIDRKYLEEQQQWFRETIESNPSQWIIVGTHAGGITCGVYEHDAKWVKRNWVPLFEEYQVDLAISGHEHIYIRKDLQYQDEYNEELGVTYLVAPAGAHKQYSANYKDGMVVYQTNYKACVLTITSTRLTTTLYDESGNETEYKFTLTPKRSSTVEEKTDSVLLKGVKLNYDKANDDANISWNGICYGNVKNVKAEITLNNNTRTLTKFIASPKVTSLNIGPIFTDYNYLIKVTLQKKNNEELVKEFEIINRVPYKLTLSMDGGTVEDSDKWNEYLSGGSIKLPLPIKAGHKFLGWYENSSFTGESVTHITKDVTGDKTYYAKWEKLNTITYNARGGILGDDIITSFSKDDLVILPAPTKENDSFLGWYQNEDFSGNVLFEIPKGTTKDITLYAKWESDNKQVEETTKKCGKKCGALVIELISATALLGLIFKKHE